MTSIRARAAYGLVAAALVAAGTPRAAHAQAITTCYTKNNGTLYRIGVANTPATCTNPGHTLETWGAKIDANGVLSLTNANGLVAGGTIGQGNAPASGAGTRMTWFPAKAAFRAGTVNGTQWDAVSTGLASFAAGDRATASGDFSTAFGQNATASGQFSFAAGWMPQATAQSTVALGSQTKSTAAGAFAGGIQSEANGVGSVALGSGAHANGDHSVAVGNQTFAGGAHAVAIGNIVAAVGAGSVVLGSRAGTSNTAAGSFVFGDQTGAEDPLDVTTPNTFAVRASGGVQFKVAGGGCALPAGGGQWACSSSRLMKRGFADVDGEDVLAKLRALPVQRWSYKAEGGVQHIGPMAQDFHAVFGLGSDDATIGVLDAAGVSLAGVKALEMRTTRLQAENAALSAELDELRALIVAIMGPR